MALQKSIKFANSLILLGDGGGPEVFAHPCGFKEMSMQLEIESNDTILLDCADIGAPGWKDTDIIARQMVLSGSGEADMDALPSFDEWWFDDTKVEKNVRWFRDLTAAEFGRYYEGPAVLTDWQETNSKGGRLNFNCTIKMNGKPSQTLTV